MTTEEEKREAMLSAAAITWADVVCAHPSVLDMNAAQAFEIGFLKGLAYLKRIQEERAARAK